MIMSNGHLRSALACAFIGLIFSSTPGFAQHPPVRKAFAQRRTQYATNRYIVFLQDPPVSARFGAREQLQAAAAVSYRAQIETKQRAMKADLASRRIQVAGSVSTVLN